MMKNVMFLAFAIAAASIVWAQAAVPTVAENDDDEYEEIVIRRKKKKKAAPVAQVAAPVAAPTMTPKADEPPPPPEPPAAEAAEPRRLVRYFCKAWKDEDWERLWWAMEPSYRKSVPLKKFKKIFADDAEGTGGLKDENILEEGKTNTGEGVRVELIFKFPRAKHRLVMAEVRRVPGGGFRVAKSPIIPVDFDDL